VAIILSPTTERQLTEAWWQWLRYKFPDVSKGTFHVPNEGKRSAVSCRILKNSGMVKGVADFIMLWPASSYNGAVFEFKSITGRLSPEQKLFLAHVKSCNYYTQVFRDIDTAINITSQYILDELTRC